MFEVRLIPIILLSKLSFGNKFLILFEYLPYFYKKCRDKISVEKSIVEIAVRIHVKRRCTVTCKM